MADSHTGGKLAQWPHNSKVRPGYPPEDVQEHCVRDEEWQKVRLSMKGEPTHVKLRILLNWWELHAKAVAELTKSPTPVEHEAFYPTECQVGNYLGALRRGGQLDMDNNVRKFK